ncbi:hypothetical protein ACNFU2_07695 [Chryseobacterium sp. PTM-20240506]|uniref:hypothetical protein n=1 Tax=unclassified Chryseobacterium TaxID=2593645 RepID=UPI002358487A|nr:MULTISPECIES: hypothetical protein [unclassified Chryseobacterium]MDC8104678.1 hypothetical protein [Chryseobacterium sp. B21-037]MDQ1806218.1 hypothetical protein [Chryseobacterium sp. CKR4-1]
MKNYIIALGLFITSFLHAQFVPQRYAIKISDMNSDLPSVKQNYSFYSYSYKLSNDEEQAKTKQTINNYKNHNSGETEYIYVPLYPNYNNSNDVSILKIVHNDKVMTVYFSFNRNLSEGEVIYLDHFYFVPGTYFLKVEEQANYTHQEIGKKVVTLPFSNAKMISAKKLRDIFRKIN